MKFNELLKERYSVRNYSTQPIENEKLNMVLEAARLAPSAVNYQPVRLYVVMEKGKLSDIKGCYHREWIKNAPVVIVAVGLHSVAWKRGSDLKDSTDIDTAIAIDHMTLQATELGLGTCWVCNFDVDKCRKILELNQDEEPIALLPIGYPADVNTSPKKRKRLDEMVIWS
jgi:nitroreductase